MSLLFESTCILGAIIGAIGLCRFATYFRTLPKFQKTIVLFLTGVYLMIAGISGAVIEGFKLFSTTNF